MPYLQDLVVEFVSLVDRAAVRDPSNPTEPQKFILTKSEVPVWKAERGANQPPTGGSMTPEELAAKLEKAEADLAEANAKAEKLEKKLAKASKKDEPVELDKSELDPRVREALEKAEAKAQAAEERIAKAEELAKAERDERITRDFIAKAEKDFPHVGGDSSEFGKLLKSASEKLSKEEFEALETRLRAANEQVATSEMFKQFGDSRDPIPSSGDVSDLTRKAEELRKSDPSLSEYEAQMRVLSSDREAQARYLSTVR